MGMSNEYFFITFLFGVLIGIGIGMYAHQAMIT
jgi:hypothetical protein